MLTVQVVARTKGAVLHLGGITKAIKDLRPFFLGTLEPHITGLITQQFVTRGKVFGPGPWRRLSQMTIEARSRRGAILRDRFGRYKKNSGKRISKRGRAKAGVYAQLEDSRRLWAAYVKPQGPESQRIVTAHEYHRIVTVPYARYHQSGYPSVVYGRRTGRNVPARIVFPRSARDVPAPVVRAWEGLFVQYLDKQIKKAGK
jgi:hypothetical protein